LRAYIYFSLGQKSMLPWIKSRFCILDFFFIICHCNCCIKNFIVINLVLVLNNLGLLPSLTTHPLQLISLITKLYSKESLLLLLQQQSAISAVALKNFLDMLQVQSANCSSQKVFASISIDFNASWILLHIIYLT